MGINKNSKIVITGANGFIGSCVLNSFRKLGYRNLVAVDLHPEFKDFINHSPAIKYIQAKDFLHEEMNSQYTEKNIELIIHLGAYSNTEDMDPTLFNINNFEYSRSLFYRCIKHHIPIIYASSAATYGDGERGFSDNHDYLLDLEPLNPYGISKHNADKMSLSYKSVPPFWAGLKFFNVYGPNEYHKGRQASMIYHLYNQVKGTAKANLFKSYKHPYTDGEQLRDFIYVKDIISVIEYLINRLEGEPSLSGIYNVGTGIPRSFNDVAMSIFDSLEIKPSINYIPMPDGIKESYQYYTCADMAKLKSIGYDIPFYSLEDGVHDYIQNYLKPTYY